MDLERERERERERELGEFWRDRAWKIWVGSDFWLEVNMSLSSNALFGSQESLRKIEKVIANNFFLIFKTEKKKSI